MIIYYDKNQSVCIFIELTYTSSLQSIWIKIQKSYITTDECLFGNF